MTLSSPKRMLVILAHPDDESFAIGGTLAKFSHQGVQVILLTATRGEAGIDGLEPETAAKIREQELFNAAKHLGVDVKFLGYIDGELSKVDPHELIDCIVSWIDKIKPQVVITFGADGISGHPDHITISHTVTQAVEQYCPNICLLHIAPSEATAIGCGVPVSSLELEKPLISVDISDYKIQKILAIQSHMSQNPPLKGKPAEELDNIPCHEYFIIAHSINKPKELMDCFDHLNYNTDTEV